MDLNYQTVFPLMEKLQAYQEPVTINESHAFNMIDHSNFTMSINATINDAKKATKFILDNQKTFKLKNTYASKDELIAEVLEAIETCADYVMPDETNGFKVDDETFNTNLV